MKKPKIKGFLNRPKLTASGAHYRGRFTCHEVQWTGEGKDALATFTITAEELADAAESQLLWTDQDVQRGIQPGLSSPPTRELSLSDGYPDTKFYIFDANKADDITEKLLRDERLFLGPLVWNLRPGKFEAYWNARNSEIFIYAGKIYLPDSHHRQQAILKAVRAWRDAPSSYPRFSPSKQFKIELYFLSKEDEGNYFFDKNQRPKPTAKSKAYDLTTLDDLSLLAKKVIGKSSALLDNVNRVTDRLTSKNPQVITLSTLREMMRAIAPEESLDEPAIEGLATVAATFYDLLAEVRTELGHLEPHERRIVRENLIVDAAVMMHGYASLMREFNDAIAEEGVQKAVADWQQKLQKLSSHVTYSLDRWSGDLFAKQNPLWQRVGVIKPGRDGKRLTVLNTGAARSGCGRVLKQLLVVGVAQTDLRFLVTS
ncbi:MAG: DNA sulfur modification protein DndB [Deltaproteobacteria bacterium]|nr:DNA sulfur modification protein DndB [Deltaproteobacteria bacterium]